MKENITYGECLSEILLALNIKASWLAREINIDSSLVYKWIRNERVPSYESPYINLILKSIVKRLSNSSSKKAIIEVLNSYGVEVLETNDTHILKLLRFILESSQYHSIMLQKKTKEQKKLYSARISSVEGFIESIDTHNSTIGNTPSCIEKRNVDDLIGKKKLFSGRDKVQIVQGNLKVLNSALNLLKQAPSSPRFSDSILITLNGDLSLLHNTKDLHRYLMQTLYELLNNGWNIILMIKLDSNVNRSITIIEDIQILLATGNLKIYYHKHSTDSYNASELFIVPEIGALLSFSAYAKNRVDSAFLFHSKESIKLLTANYFQSLVSSKPLLKSYPPQDSAEIQKEFAECEESQGDKYVFKDGFSTITMPLSLYERYLNSDGESSQDVSYRMFLHQKRLSAFEMQIRHFAFQDICFIESIEELVEKRKYSFDENYILKNNKPDYCDIVCHLENVIHLLQMHKNYEIAFVNQEQYKRMSGINWMVKGKDSVLIETFNKNSPFNDRLHSEMNFIITEKSIVNAFHDYFLILWNNIPDENKDKNKSIAWLKLLIEECKRRADSKTD